MYQTLVRTVRFRRVKIVQMNSPVVQQVVGIGLILIYALVTRRATNAD